MGLFDFLKANNTKSNIGINKSSYQYNFKNPAQKEFASYIINSIRQADYAYSEINNQLSFNQLKSILEPDLLYKIVDSLMYFWKTSLDQDRHIMGGIPNTKNVNITISCCPVNNISIARDEYIGMRYPYLITYTMKQANHNILKTGFIHILFCMDRNLTKYNIDFFSMPSGEKALLLNLLSDLKEHQSLVLPRKEYFKGTDAEEFGKVFSEALTRDGLI